MRKYLFLAIALVASALAFTSCDPNNPQNPGDVQVVGTMWRVDSVSYDGRPSPQPYVIGKFISESQVILDGVDTTTWSYKDDVFTIRRYDYEEAREYKVVEVNKTFAHLKTTDSENKELHIYASIIPEATGTTLPLTAENIIGTWRGDYYVSSGSYVGNGGTWHQYYQMTSSMQTHGLDILEFKADGTLTYTNMLDKASMGASYQPPTGFWAIKDGQFAYQYDVDRLYDGYYFDVEALTDNVFYITRSQVTQTSAESHWCHFSKVK